MDDQTTWVLTLVWPSEFLAMAKAQGEPRDRVWGMAKQAEYPQDCINCGGVGTMAAFVVSDIAPDRETKMVLGLAGDRLRRGYYLHAPCPVCRGDSRGAWLTQACGLYGDDLAVRLDDFRSMPGKMDAKAKAGRLLSMVPSPAGFVTFVGEPGRGKSHLLKAVVNGCRLAGVLAKYERAADMLASIRDTFNGDPQESAEMLVMRYRGMKVLCIDEIDKVNLTPWAQETLFRLIDWRYEQRGNVLTCMGTNKLLGELPGYLASRLSSEVVEVGGIDMRPLMAGGLGL